MSLETHEFWGRCRRRASTERGRQDELQNRDLLLPAARPLGLPTLPPPSVLLTEGKGDRSQNQRCVECSLSFLMSGHNLNLTKT